MNHLLLFSFLFSFNGFQLSDHEIELCQAGCHHAKEVTMDFSNSWFGIYKVGTSDEFEIRKVHPFTRPCHDPIFDNEKDSLSGREVLIKEDYGASLLLLSGLALKEGKMDIAFINNPRCLFPGDYIRLRLNDKDYALMATGTIEFDTTNKRMVPYIKNYKVLLVENMYDKPVVQEIISFDQLYASEEVQPAIFFAGDIDRDGQLDILYDLSDHYNRSNITLFLSSKAAPGKLVKQVASWNITGC
jgi:hypothetical protein